jgi:hypothetical protein
MGASRDNLAAENDAVFEALHRARPHLIGLAAAKDAIPQLNEGLILHAGPPIAWQEMQPAMRAAVLGGLVFEGRAADLAEGAAVASSGVIRFAPAHNHDAADAMAGNGREVGIRTSGTGKKWFTAPAEVAELRLFEGHTIEDATPTMGDSYVTEVIGLGGFALAAAPAIAEFIGGKASDLAERSAVMRRITIREHPEFRIPALDFRGVPSGIDVFKVAETGITPMVNTGVASKRPGIGQVGAGTQSFPLACFTAAAGSFGDPWRDGVRRHCCKDEYAAHSNFE